MSIENKKEQNIDEGLSWAGKLFFTSMAAQLAHDTSMKVPLKIKGTPEQIKALAEAVASNKAVQDELKNPNATVESVYRALMKKTEARDAFKAATGSDFPV